jgi:hypothetical protein
MPSWPVSVLVVLRYCSGSGLQLTLDTLAGSEHFRHGPRALFVSFSELDF